MQTSDAGRRAVRPKSRLTRRVSAGFSEFSRAATFSYQTIR